MYKRWFIIPEIFEAFTVKLVTQRNKAFAVSPGALNCDGCRGHALWRVEATKVFIDQGFKTQTCSNLFGFKN
jgi:hypothetical protein